MVIALIISAIAWFAYNLNKEYSEVVSVLVYAQSNIEGRAAVSSNSSQISARIKATGYYMLIQNSRRERQKTIRIDGSDLKSLGDDLFEISESSLRKYFASIFSPEAQLESYQMNAAQFRFMPEHHKRIPIVPMQDIDYSPQYINNGEVKLSPDSVTIYGDPARIKDIEQIFTSRISLKDVHSNVNGTVNLDNPGGIRLSLAETRYSLQVMRYFEITKKVQVKMRNVPKGMKLMVFPNTVDVTFRCPFPYRANPEESIIFYVDYNEYLSSLTGKCVVRTEKKNNNLISFTVSPEICDCLAISNAH